MATANHVLLRRITLTASASSVTFDSIPQTGYTDLKLVMSLRSTAGGGTNWDPLCYRFNGSTSGYSTRELYGNGSSAGSATNTTITSAGAGGTWGRLQDYGITTSNQTANTFSSIELLIPNYTSSNQKSLSFDSVYETNATAAYAEMVAGIWTGTAAVSSIDFALYTGSFVAGSSFSLYGLADVNTTPTAAPKADGGDIIKTDGTYWYHAFTGSGIFKPQLNLTADVLVVAGGGAGWPDAGGGGGAGGLLAFTNQSLTATSYTCVVGSGGSASGYTTTNGVNSQFASLTASVGGGKGGYSGTSGGSGGGSRDGAPGSATSGQGYAGGQGTTNSGGGGGGAGAAGAAGSGNNGGNGGAGVNTYSSWATATSTGASGYYAGGGGGGPFTSATPGAGGAGGGGNASSAGGSPGLANTGGGGGSCVAGNNSPGNGGSGIIIIRYTVA